MKGFPERWIIILRAVYPWRNFPLAHLIGRLGDQFVLDRFADIKDIKKEILERLETHFEKWLNP